MNCCDDYGNCNQGRDCPARKREAEDGEELSELDTLVLYVIVEAGLGLLVTFVGLTVGYVVGMLA